MEEKFTPGDQRPNFKEEYERADQVGEPLAAGLDSSTTPMQPQLSMYADSTPANEKWAEDLYRETPEPTTYPEP